MLTFSKDHFLVCEELVEFDDMIDFIKRNNLKDDWFLTFFVFCPISG